jgi:hypothetical protein
VNSVAELEAKESHFTPIPNRDERPPVTRTAPGQRLLTIPPGFTLTLGAVTQPHPRPLRGVGVDLTIYWLPSRRGHLAVYDGTDHQVNDDAESPQGRDPIFPVH